MILRIVSLCLVFTLLQTPGRVPTAFAAKSVAGRASARSLSKSLSGAALASYESAKLLFNDGDFSGALVKFKAAYDAQPDPRLLWNMAVCEKNLRHYQNVKTLTQQYLKDAEEQRLLSEADRTSAKALLETVERFSSAMRVDVAEPGVEILVDGKLVATTPVREPIAINVGQHTVVLQKKGFRTQSFMHEEAGGGEWLLQATMEKQSGVLEIKAPPQASVTVLDQALGGGTIRKELPPGRYLLRVTAPQKLPYEVEVTVEDREQRSITPHLEDPPSGRAWLWVLAGVTAVTVAAVGGYFLFQPRTAPLEDRGAFTVVELQQRSGL